MAGLLFRALRQQRRLRAAHLRSLATASPRSRKWRLELLEDRRLLTTFAPTIFTDSSVAGAGSLRDAIIAANADSGSATDTIQLRSGNYTLSISNSPTGGHENASATGDLNVTSPAHTLIIAGVASSGPNVTIIQQTVLDRVIEIAAGATVELENLEITGGTAVDLGSAGELPFANGAAHGGGLLNNGSAILQNVVVISNLAGSTTGVNSSGGGADAAGGGISNTGTLGIENSIIENNRVIGGNSVSAGALAGGAAGGGVASSSTASSTIIINTTVQSNAAQGGQGAAGSASAGPGAGGTVGGGGVGLEDSGSVTLTDDTFANNTAAGGNGGDAQFPSAFGGAPGGSAFGAGIGWSGAGSLTLANDTISGNSATGGDGGTAGSVALPLGQAGSAAGGGFDEFTTGPKTLTNVTVTGNAAATGVEGSILGVASPGATAKGGGLALLGSSDTIQNSIIAGNIANANPGSDGSASGSDVAGTATTTDHDLVGIYDTAAATGFSSAHADILGSMAVPISPGLGTLQSNGGPTATEAESVGSPAIGAGDPAAAASAMLATDQRGAGFSRIVSNKVDIGAFQVQPGSPAAAVTPVNLSTYYNLQGIASDGQKFSGGLDGVGNDLSANLLGSSLTLGGVTFDLGPTGVLNVVQAAAQAVNLPAGSFSKLELLATGVEGNQHNQTFTVNYVGGTSQTFSQSISDWYTPQDYTGESVAQIMSYRDQSSGGKDHRNFDVYQYSLNLDTSKTVASITLPNNGHVEVLAVSLVAAVSAPTNLMAMATASAVNLAWTAPIGTITGYNVFRGTFSGGESAVPLNTTPIPAGTTSFHDSSVVPGDTYFYVVQALDGSTVSADSNQMSAAVPAAGTTTPVDLRGAFNRVGIAADGQKFSGGLDGVGNALSANLLGSSLTAGGVTFNLGATGGPNVVQSLGQSISLPAGSFAKLELLATGVEGSQGNQRFTVNYTTGIPTTLNQSISDWYAPQDYPGESVAQTMAYRDQSSGGMDHRNFNVYQYSLTLDPTRTVESITLPNNSHVQVLATSLVEALPAPTGLTATATSGAVNLLWTAPNGGATVTGYNVFRGTVAASVSITPLNSAPLLAGTTSYQDSSVVAGNTYFYVVQAIYGPLVSADSNSASAPVPAAGTTAQVDLTGAFNRVGITADGQKFLGGLDGVGNALSGNLLGSNLTSGGVAFKISASGVVQSLGQTIGLPAGLFSKLELLATGVEGNQPNQTFVVQYTDGTSQTFNQSLSDWYTAQGYAGESVALTMAYRNQSNGNADHRNFNVYQYALTLDASRVVSSITLPSNGHVEVLAITAVG